MVVFVFAMKWSDGERERCFRLADAHYAEAAGGLEFAICAALEGKQTDASGEENFLSKCLEALRIVVERNSLHYTRDDRTLSLHFLGLSFYSTRYLLSEVSSIICRFIAFYLDDIVLRPNAQVSALWDLLPLPFTLKI